MAGVDEEVGCKWRSSFTHGARNGNESSRIFFRSVRTFLQFVMGTLHVLVRAYLMAIVIRSSPWPRKSRIL
ncbi:hypothetical protein ASPVEDRAFT_712569 [Aspergillus versicolor CBS 583.65]|uniref:Uncharacterized protein n=1 Tax=Aspergillus versicolor CBS 583.65 TaxID=1036611 RepID=A0A1L9PNA3_ASPVE|nr:uncharacterized protein ASPVEDRAFT_712569 [Aspergillus versicolor CBS 583.65]OJJ03004.1 hypothetical protein ASPVEDRAFT_712569 [Aspergillus versicolor CBS 583.65]